MSRLIFAFAAVVAAAAFAVPAVLAEKGNRDTDTIFQEQFERMRRETQDLRERFRGRFENRGRPIDRVRRGTLAGRAIAVGDVSAVSAFSITVGEKTFVVTDETQIPDDLEVGDFVVVRGEIDRRRACRIKGSPAGNPAWPSRRFQDSGHGRGINLFLDQGRR